MKYRKATVTITADVFVLDEHVQREVDSIHPHHPEVSVETHEKEAFEYLARLGISALAETDDPIKVRDVYVDMNTFQ